MGRCGSIPRTRQNGWQQVMSGEVWIIIPTFRRAAMLMECLDSLSRQTYGRANPIVVIDGWEPDTRSDLG